MLDCIIHTPAWLSFLMWFGNTSLIVYLSQYGNRSSTVVWFRTFLFFGSLYALSDGFLRCAPNNSWFQIWLDVFGLSIAILSVVMLIFILHFINKQQILNNSSVRLGLFAIVLTITWLYWRTDTLAIRDLSAAAVQFGNTQPAYGKLVPLIAILFAFTNVLPIFVLAAYYRHLDDINKKKEVRLVLIAFLIGVLPPVVIIGVITPLLRIPALPIAPFFTLIMNITIAYAITRHGLRVFNLDNLAGNVMQITPGGLLILDHTNTVQYANLGAAQMLGYTSPNQIASLSAKKLFKSNVDYGHFQTNILSQIAPEHQVMSQEAEFITKQKHPLAISLNATGVYYGDQLVYRLISFTDITRLKTAEAELEAEKASVERKIVERTRELTESQAQLTAAVHSLPFGFAVINRKNEVLSANSLLTSYVGQEIPLEPAASHRALEQITANFRPAIDLLDCIQKAQTDHRPLERNITRGANFYRFYFMPVITLSKGLKDNVLGTVLLMEDTTEAKALERSRDEFFSIASHELRTPLTAIRGNTDMIKDNFPKELKNPDLHEMIDDIYTASVRLIDIVNDFLDMSRLEQGKIAFINQPFDALALAQETIRQYDVTASRRKIALQVTAPDNTDIWAVADKDRVRQILVNLIGNSMHATDEGSIKVAFEPGDDIIKIFVTDTGHGIPEKLQHLLFHKFQQASGSILTRDNTHSTGLGLYISRLLAEGIHGKLYLEHSEIGKGTTFVLEIPRATDAKPMELRAKTA